MLHFEQLDLKSCIYFANATLRLDTGKILQICGVNRKSREKLQTNGAGKSLFFSYIPNILYANHPLGTSAQAKKELYATSEATATLALRVDDVSYSITQKNANNKIGYTITCDQQSIAAHTATNAERFIDELNPISEAEFYTLVYLNSQRDFIFQRGKFEARLKFFTEFFRLDYYDQMKEYFQAQLKQVKKVEVEASVHESNRIRCVEKLQELNSSLLPDISECEEQKATLKKKIRRNRAVLQKIEDSIHYHKSCQQYLQSIDGVPKPTAARLQELQQQLQVSQYQLQVSQQLQECTTQLAKFKRLQTDLTTDLNTIYQTLFATDFTGEVYSITSVEDQYRASMLQYQRYQQLQGLLQEYEPASATIPELQRQLATYTQQIEVYQRLQQEGASTLCPVCQSPVDIQSIRQQAKFARSQSSIVQAQIEIATLQDTLQTWTLDQHKVLRKQQKRNTILQEELATVQEAVANIQRAQAKFKHYKTVKQSLQQQQQECIPVEVLSQELYTAQATLKLYQQYEKLLQESQEFDLYFDNTLDQLYEHKKKVLATLHSHEVTIEHLSLQLHRHALQEENIKVYTQQLQTISSILEDLQTVLADKEILELLIGVYSSKGLKICKIAAICTVLEKNLNHFKSLLFGENFKFSIHITEKNFDIIVDRGDNMVSDVRNLSGSEGRRFNLLLLISLLPLTPSSRRSNLVILDEMEANGDQVTIDMFCKRYLPELHKHIPNIVVISPQMLPIPDAKKVFVIKDKDGAKIAYEDL